MFPGIRVKMGEGITMVYKQKLTVLGVITCLLALVFTGTLIFSPERVSRRDNQYTWLDPKWKDQVDRIEIRGGEGETVFVRRNGLWAALYSGREYPVREDRIADLLSDITARGEYPVRGRSSSSHAKFGLSDAASSRIILRAGPAALPLLELLVGDNDLTGNEVYYRKGGEDEVRSGSNTIAGYFNYSRTSFYDLGLFSDAEGYSPEDVYRLTVIAPSSGEGVTPPLPEPLVITGNGGDWTVDGIAGEELDLTRVKAYIRMVLNSGGDDFEPGLNAEAPVFNEGRILVEFGDGTSKTLRLGVVLPNPGSEESGQRRAAVSSDRPYVYVLSPWTMTRLFRDAGYFRKDQDGAD
jgi:hypothetical protein